MLHLSTLQYVFSIPTQVIATPISYLVAATLEMAGKPILGCFPLRAFAAPQTVSPLFTTHLQKPCRYVISK